MAKDIDLDSYLANAKDILTVFESRMGWEKPDLKNVEHVACPYDAAHMIPEARLSTHVKTCKWRKLGCTREEIQETFEQEEKTKTQDEPNAIDLDKIIHAIAPGTKPIRTDEGYKCSLNCDQRLAVYEASVAQMYKSERKMPDKALYADLEAKAAEKLYQKENPENLTELEMLQRLRDMKRRRQTYRAKNVHITKRSQTEIIRGVLEVHMEELSKLWNPCFRRKEKNETDLNGNRKAEKRKSEESSTDHHQHRKRKRDHEYEKKSKRKEEKELKKERHRSRDTDRSRSPAEHDTDKNSSKFKKREQNADEKDEIAAKIHSARAEAESRNEISKTVKNTSETSAKRDADFERGGSEKDSKYDQKRPMPFPKKDFSLKKSRYSLSEEASKERFSSRQEEVEYFGYQVNQSISFYKTKLMEDKQREKWEKKRLEKIPEHEKPDGDDPPAQNAAGDTRIIIAEKGQGDDSDNTSKSSPPKEKKKKWWQKLKKNKHKKHKKSKH